MTKQHFLIDADPEEFIYVCHEPSIQKELNKRMEIFEKLINYQKDNYKIEVYHTISKKILMFNPKEALYIKYIKKITEDHIISVNKSITLADVGNLDYEKINFILSGYIYHVIEKVSYYV